MIDLAAARKRREVARGIADETDFLEFSFDGHVVYANKQVEFTFDQQRGIGLAMTAADALLLAKALRGAALRGRTSPAGIQPIRGAKRLVERQPAEE